MFFEVSDESALQRLAIWRCFRMALFGPALLAASSVMMAPPAAADVVWLKDGNVLYGVVDIESEEAIEFKVWSESGLSTKQTLSRSEISSLVVNIDKTRMATLVPGNLEGYRDYAEELFGYRKDPVAEQLAIRLYLIVAFGDNSEAGALRQNALRMLPRLARDETELRKFSLLQAIYSDSRLVPEQTENSPVDTGGNDQLLRCLQHLRRGETRQAGDLLAQPAVMNAAARSKDICSLAELKEMVLLNRLAPEQLERILRLERFLKHPETGALRKAPNDWGVQSRIPFGIWAEMPTFQNVTEFDPAKSLFRDGNWSDPPIRK